MCYSAVWDNCILAFAIRFYYPYQELYPGSLSQSWLGYVESGKISYNMNIFSYYFTLLSSRKTNTGLIQDQRRGYTFRCLWLYMNEWLYYLLTFSLLLEYLGIIFPPNIVVSKSVLTCASLKWYKIHQSLIENSHY